jgi:hypothetical protein
LQGVIIFTFMRVPKSIKIFLNYFLGPLLFIGLAFSIFQQIRHQPHLSQSWEEIKESFFSYKLLYLVLALVLIFVNWGIETWKWKLLIGSIRPISFFTAYKAVLSGVSFSVALPNRVGEYIGRMMYQPEGGRLKTIALAIVGSIAQLLATVLWGIVGLIVLRKELLQAYPQAVVWYQFIIYGLLFILLLLSVFYFYVSSLISFFRPWLRNHHFLYLVEALQNFNARFLAKLFFLSSLRYGVFLLQYIVMFYFFHVDVAIAIIVPVMSVVFLALAVIPSIALIEVGFRGEVSLRLMGLFSANSLGIGLTSVTIWFVNLILPAIIGTLFLLNIKLLSKNEKD